MKNEILLYEELLCNSHPALQTQLYDGWALRFANGYSYRANSVHMFYPSVIPPQVKINECEKRYFSQGLNAAFKIIDGTEPEIENILQGQAYEIVAPTYVMTMSLQKKNFFAAHLISTAFADEKWLNAYYEFNHFTDGHTKKNAHKIMTNVNATTVYGRIEKDGVTAACGSTVIERGYAALLNIVVDSRHRGKGLGGQLCESLLAEALKHSAHTTYLQVIQNNENALSLYKKLGYEVQYTSHFRVKER